MNNKGDINSIDIPGHKTLSEKDSKFGHLTVIVNTIDLFNFFKQIKSYDFMVHVSGSAVTVTVTMFHIVIIKIINIIICLLLSSKNIRDAASIFDFSKVLFCHISIS